MKQVIKMKIYLTPIFLFILILTFSGCFEIIEEITLNDDGSGKINMTLNLSKSRARINSIMRMDSINDYKVPSKSDIQAQISDMVKEIKRVSGVSNVNHSINFDDFIFSVSCDFSNIDVLNKIITHFVTSQTEVRNLNQNKQFDYDAGKKIFKRNYHYNLAEEIKNVRNKDREVLEGASVTTIYRFGSMINKSENKDAKISGSKKAIMLKVDAEEMINNRKNIKNTIYLEQ